MSFFCTEARAVALPYQAQPDSAAKKEADRSIRHERTGARFKPLDKSPNTNGEDDEFTPWA
jgi:hypothetical protein